jgi:glycosyltransferase involved in cell wall biosynthesis
MKILVLSNCPLVGSQGSGYVITSYARELRQRGHVVDSHGPESFEILAGLRAARVWRLSLGMALFVLRSGKACEVDLVVFHGGECGLAVLLLRLLHARARLVQHSNGLETPLPDSFHGLSFKAERSLTLGYCGGWYARKGVDLVAASSTALLRSHPRLRLHLAGVGPDFRAADVFPPDVADRVHVTAFIADKQSLQRWYSQISVFLMPSYSESFGLVVSEAMACGCAVVASSTGFAAGLLPDVEALVADDYTAAAYTAAVQRLLDDECLRRAIAARGHARVQLLHWAGAAQQLDQFYRLLLATPAVSAGASAT